VDVGKAVSAGCGGAEMEIAMSIQALGYVGVRAKSIEDWAGFGEKFLGMQLIDKSRAGLAFRMDDRKQRLVVAEDGGEGVAFFGWEVADAAALDAFAAQLEAAGVQVTRGTRALAEERRVKDLIVFSDPLGNRLEVFHGAEVATDPFRPGRNISGFRTGPLGMGHAVLHVKNINDALPFYRDLLGFRLSDYMTKPFNAYFFHANPRHHSVAFIETGRSATHHLMVELYSLDDVGQGYDLAVAEEGRIGVTLGRHINDEVTSFYANSPSGFMVEYGWGGRVIDVENWQPQEVGWGPSIWGHDRMWMPPEGRVEARKIRIAAAASGLRKPLNVIEGNYQVMAGACPWWDAVRAGEAAE
jgi:2,3-dihydroxybiphenyl 1,2-dioxygenase